MWSLYAFMRNWKSNVMKISNILLHLAKESPHNICQNWLTLAKGIPWCINHWKHQSVAWKSAQRLMWPGWCTTDLLLNNLNHSNCESGHRKAQVILVHFLISIEILLLSDWVTLGHRKKERMIMLYFVHSKVWMLKWKSKISTRGIWVAYVLRGE